MIKEARLLKTKSLRSLTLSIELFNRPSDVGRTDSVLMLLDHSFEMLLKQRSSIVAPAFGTLERRTRSGSTPASVGHSPASRRSAHRYGLEAADEEWKSNS